MAKTTVLLADDHVLVRQGLRALLEAEPDIEVVGEATTGREALELAGHVRPDLVVMDVVMPELNGLEAARQILGQIPKCRVLMLSSYSDEEYIHQSAEIGALGYVLKQTSAADLVTAIRETCKGNAFLSPAISRRLIDRYRAAVSPGSIPRQSWPRLTRRETQVLQLVAAGRANKQIADDLKLSIKTVQRHRQKVMNKLNIHNTAGLTRYAITEGIAPTGMKPGSGMSSEPDQMAPPGLERTKGSARARAPVARLAVRPARADRRPGF